MGYRNYSVALGKIVDPNGQGDFTTLAAALAASSSGETIFLKSSVTENVTLPPGVNIANWYGSAANTPSIIGTVSMTGAGTSSITGLRLVTNGAVAISVTGSAASILNINNCYLDFTDNTGITHSSTNASSQIIFYNCNGDLGTTGIGIFTKTSPGELRFYQCNIDNSGGSSTASTSSTGPSSISYSFLKSPFSLSGDTNFACEWSSINTSAINATSLTTSDSAMAAFRAAVIGSGTASALSIGAGSIVNIISDTQLSSTNTNAITGLGTLQFGNIIFPSGLSSGINVPTQNSLVSLGGGWSLIKTLTASASATLDFTTLPTYTCYAFKIQNLTLATTAQQLLFRISNDNGSSFAATGYTAGINYTSYNSATVTNVNSTTAYPLTSNANSGVGISGLIFQTPSNAFLWGTSTYLSTDSGVNAFGTTGGSGNITANAFRFLSSSGNLAAGTITIYGLKS